MPDSTERDPPSPTEDAAEVATMAIAMGAAVAAKWFPVSAAVAASAFTFAIGKFVKRGERILADRLRKGEVELLSAEKHAELIPMAYRFFEAVKQGEYEHTLEVLAAFIVGELGEDAPEASNFARIARRLEGISQDELRVIAAIANGLGPSRPKSDLNGESYSDTSLSLLGVDLTDLDIEQVAYSLSLHELANRGLLRGTWHSNFGGSSILFHTTRYFWELVDKAGEGLPVDRKESE